MVRAEPAASALQQQQTRDLSGPAVQGQQQETAQQQSPIRP